MKTAKSNGTELLVEAKTLRGTMNTIVMARATFVSFVTVYAVNNSREQHRYYFDETGKLIWQNRKRLRGPGYFAPQDIERLVNVDPARAFANDEGLQGVKLQT